MKAQKTKNRGSSIYRLQLEPLAQRLMPGDALCGILFSGSFVDSSITRNDLPSINRGVPIVELDDLTRPVAAIRPSLPRKPVFDAAVDHVDAVPTHIDATHAGVPRRERVASHRFSANALALPDRVLAGRESMIAAPGAHGSAAPHPALAQVSIINPLLAVENAATHAPWKSQASQGYGNLPLTFETNQGQFDSRVDFVTRTDGATVFLTPTAAVFSLKGPDVGGQGAAVHMQIVDANPDATPLASEQQPGIVNYFIGNDPNNWHTNVATFGRVQYQDVYSGIDLVYHGNNGQMDYDFVVSPGAEPDAITLNFAGAEHVEVNRWGDLILHTAVGEIVQQKPFTYQETSQTRQEVASRYVVDGTQVRFELGTYDATRPLVIDPLVLGYSTFLGGSGAADIGYAIAVDGTGNAYVTGETFAATTFPDTPGAFDNTYDGSRDAFVAKLNATGTGLAYATYLGGAGGSVGDFGYGIAVDDDGNAYVAGRTDTSSFPTTLGALDTTFNGSEDGFLVKLNATGSALVYSTYLGGAGFDAARAVALDTDGNAYVTGYTSSADFPTTAGAFDVTHNFGFDVFVTKFNAAGAALDYSTYLGGAAGGGFEEGYGIAVDVGGSAYLTGYTSSGDFPTTALAFDTTYNGGISDVFAAKLSVGGSTLVYGTYLGGALEDKAFGIAVDADGSAYLTGRTTNSVSGNFPTTVGAFDTTHNGSDDAFITKLLLDGTGLAYGTFVGGTATDAGFGIAVDSGGNAYVTGVTNSTGFPVTGSAYDMTYDGTGDALMTKLNASGAALEYSTFLGGSLADSGYGIAVDGNDNVYVTGESSSTNFPTTPGALKRRNRGTPDAFVTKFADA